MYLVKSSTTATLQHWPGQAGARAARQDGRAEFAAGRDGGDHVVGIARDDQADGNLPVVRAVGGIKRAAAAIEAHFAANIFPQLDFQCSRLREYINGFTV